MSFFKRLFGGGAAATEASASAAKTLEYKGFAIAATPYKAEGGQYQTCGVVSKEIDGTLKEHRFIRADRFSSLDDAVEVSLSKGRQLVDQLGDRLFAQ
jgi:hypothetical protein